MTMHAHQLVPLAGCKMISGGGLCVPFASRKILGEPHIRVDRHISVDQEQQLREYFGIRVPAQRTAAELRARQAQKVRAQTAQRQAGQPRAREAQAEQAQAEHAQAEQAQAEHDESGNEWVIRSEERIAINLETRESGRVRLHKYIDTEPVQQTVRVFHEELEIERVTIWEDDQIAGDMAECEQEIILHEARAKITKETIPVERVRLSARKVEEDKTVTGEIRKERIEVDDSSGNQPPRP